MAKDPAVLLYTSDFYTGTAMMTDEQVGKYMRMLCLQHQRGHFTETQLKQLSGNDPEIMVKFSRGEDGLYFNKRMDKEAKRRADYTESRRKNLHKEPHMDSHTGQRMETDTDNETVITNRTEKSKKPRVKKARLKVEPHPFTSSPLYNLENFKTAFAGSDYEGCNLSYYHATVCNWRDKRTGQPPERADWKATATRFMLNDYQSGKLVLQNHQQTNGKPTYQNKSGASTSIAEQLLREMGNTA